MTKGTKLRSVGAVFLGFLTVVVLSVLTDVLLHVTHVYPPPDQPMVDAPRLLLALAYRCAYTVAGGWVTARTAPSAPMRHVTALVVIGFVAGMAGVISSLPGTLGPLWYPIALAILSPPLAWVGGRVQAGRRAG